MRSTCSRCTVQRFTQRATSPRRLRFPTRCPASLFPAPTAFRRSTKVIAVADVVESVRLMEQGEHEFITRWHQFVNFVQDQVLLFGAAAQEPGRRPDAGVRRRGRVASVRRWRCKPGSATSTRRCPARRPRPSADRRPRGRLHRRQVRHLRHRREPGGADRLARGPGEVVISAALRDRLGRACRCTWRTSATATSSTSSSRCARFASAKPASRRCCRRTWTRAACALAWPCSLRVARNDVSGTSGETLADELVTALARSDTLQVVSRMTTAPLDADRDTLQTVWSEVGARYVLTGRARGQAGSSRAARRTGGGGTGHVDLGRQLRPGRRRQGAAGWRTARRTVAAVHGAVVQHEVSQRGPPAASLEGPSLLLASVGLMHRLSPGGRGQCARNAGTPAGSLAPPPRRACVAGPPARDARAAGGCPASPGRTRRWPAPTPRQPSRAIPRRRWSWRWTDTRGCTARATWKRRRSASAGAQHAPGSFDRAAVARGVAGLGGSGRAARHAAEQAVQGLALEPLRYLYDAVAALAAWVNRDVSGAAALAQQAVQRNPRYLPAWRVAGGGAGGARKPGRSTRRAAANDETPTGVQPQAFAGSSPMREELEARFTRALARAGVPQE